MTEAHLDAITNAAEDVLAARQETLAEVEEKLRIVLDRHSNQVPIDELKEILNWLELEMNGEHCG